MEFDKRWICEWWSDERGQEFQKETFCTLVGIIIDIITDDASGWYYNEEGDYYLPKGYTCNSLKRQVVYDFNHDIEAPLKYAQCSY